MAKLRFSHEVDQDDVDEALRLIQACRDSVDSSIRDREQEHAVGFGVDTMSEIFRIVKDACIKSKENTVRFDTIEKTVFNKGYAKEDFFKTLEKY